MIVQSAWVKKLLRQSLFYNLTYSMPSGITFVFGDLITELATHDQKTRRSL